MEANLKIAWVFAIICIAINCLSVAYFSRESILRTVTMSCPPLPPSVTRTQAQNQTQVLFTPALSTHQPSPVAKQATARIENGSSQTPFGLRLEYYKSRIFSMNHDNVSEEKQDKCTMIMLTYRRLKSLPQVITNYCNIPKLDKFLVIWNDIENPIPQSILDISKKCSVKLQFIVSKENKMSNRFWPRPEIETECACIMDDDLIISTPDIEFGIRAWKKFKHLLLGYRTRTRLYSHLKDGTYKYGNVDKNQLAADNSYGYSIILPAVFLHRAYLEMLFDSTMISNELVSYIDEIMNCDDILMSVMVTKFMNDCGWPQSAGLQIGAKSIKSVAGMSKSSGDHKGLDARPDHYTTRTKCLNKFAEFFGYLPLTPQSMTLGNSM